MSNGFKIIKSDEAIAIRPYVFTLFGTPGIGKTTLSFTMPKPLHLDFDGGIQRADQRIRPDYLEVTDVKAFIEWIESDAFIEYIKEGEYKSVILDTGGTLIDDYLAGYVKTLDYKNRNSTGGLTLAGWGAIKQTFNDQIKNRFQKLGLHICFICHDKDLGESSPVKMGLSVSGGSSDIIERVTDQLGYVYAEGSNRVISFSASQQLHKAKDTAGVGKLIIPDASSPKYDTFLADIIDRCTEKILAGSVAQIEAKKKVDEYREGIEACNDAKQFEEMMAMIEQEKGAIKAQLGQIFRERLEAVGMKYDGKKKEFVAIEKTEDEKN